jgi:hypothetical protein
VLPLYRARYLADAQLLADELRGHGIQTYIRNEALQGALGELPLTVQPEVCILNQLDWELAQSIAGRYESSQRQPIAQSDLFCARCGEQSPGNFELCWHCREPFPEH